MDCWGAWAPGWVASLPWPAPSRPNPPGGAAALPEPTGVCLRRTGDRSWSPAAPTGARIETMAVAHRFDPAARQWVASPPWREHSPIRSRRGDDTAYVIGGTDGRTYFAGVVACGVTEPSERHGRRHGSGGGQRRRPGWRGADRGGGPTIRRTREAIGAGLGPGTSGRRHAAPAGLPAVPVGVAASAVVGEELLVFGGGAWSDAAGGQSPRRPCASPRNHWRRLEPCRAAWG